MAILKTNDISKMSNKEREDRIKDLKMELIKEKINLSKFQDFKLQKDNLSLVQGGASHRHRDLLISQGCNPETNREEIIVQRIHEHDNNPEGSWEAYCSSWIIFYPL